MNNRKMIRSNQFVLKSYLKAKKLKNSIVNNHREHIFRKNCMRALKYTQECLNELGVVHFLNHGTLLGVVRDKHLIIHDQDLDISIQESDQYKITKIKDYMIKKGYKCNYEFTVDGIGIIQHAFHIFGVRVDLDYLRTFDKCDHSYVLYKKSKVVMYTVDHVENTKTIIFNGVNVSIPYDAEHFLEQMYGLNWKEPNPDYKYWDNDEVTQIVNSGNTKVYKHNKEIG